MGKNIPSTDFKRTPSVQFLSQEVHPLSHFCVAGAQGSIHPRQLHEGVWGPQGNPEAYPGFRDRALPAGAAAEVAGEDAGFGHQGLQLLEDVQNGCGRGPGSTETGGGGEGTFVSLTHYCLKPFL